MGRGYYGPLPILYEEEILIKEVFLYLYLRIFKTFYDTLKKFATPLMPFHANTNVPLADNVGLEPPTQPQLEPSVTDAGTF